MSGFLTRPQNVFLRKALFQVHLWTGIAIGLYLVLVCVTGSALAFRIYMQRAAFPHLFATTPGEVADAATLLERVRDAFPNDRVSGIDAPTSVRPTVLAYVVRGEQFLTILVDPTTGRVLGELPEQSWVRTIQDLHYELLGGRTGRIVNGAGAGLLLLMCASGLVIWWPGIATWRRALTIDFRRSWKRINWELHSAVGIWSIALVAMWAVTGIYFVWPSQFRNAVNAVSPLTVATTPTSGPAVAGAIKPTWRELIARAEQRVPEQYVQRVVPPSNAKGAFLVMFSSVRPAPAGREQLTPVYLDQYTGAVLKESPRAARRAGDVIMDWVAPLHVGSFGGMTIRVAWLVLGLVPPLLFVTGFIMWWSRVVRPRWLSARRSAVAAGLVATAIWAPQADAQYTWDLPPRVAPPAVPSNAPVTPARVELGRRLFYDKRLSGNGTQSCATCHVQERAFTDGRAQGLGSTGALHPRGPMSLINVAYRDTLTWANPNMRSLDEQTLVPLFGDAPVELGLKGHEQSVYSALAADPVYRPLFAKAFPKDPSPVVTTNVTAAIAAFERSIVSFRAPFDRYRQNEETSALSESAQRGMGLFFSNRKAGCISCHRGLNLDGGSKVANGPADEEPIFQFHNTGLYNLAGLLSYPADNTGLHAHTGRSEDVGKFRVPTLRNIAITAPYMHDGSIATLDEVIDHYAAGGRTANPSRSTGLRPFTLTPDERKDLIAFLESLTDREALRDPRWSDPWTQRTPGMP